MSTGAYAGLPANGNERLGQADSLGQSHCRAGPGQRPRGPDEGARGRVLLQVRGTGGPGQGLGYANWPGW